MSESFRYDFLISACDEPWKYTFIIMHYFDRHFLYILTIVHTGNWIIFLLYFKVQITLYLYLIPHVTKGILLKILAILMK
jgi:hypothetical protein